MFTALGTLAVRHTKLMLVLSLVAFVVTALLGGGVFGKLSAGGFEDPGSDSARAAEILEGEFNVGTPNLLIVATAKGGDVDSREASAAGAALAAELESVEGVGEVASYWKLGSPASLRSDDHGSALVLAHVDGEDEAVAAAVQRVRDRIAGDGKVLTAEVGGPAAIGEALGTGLEEDLLLAETIAIPLTLLLLLVVFRGVVAAVLPLVVGVAATVGAFFVLRLIAAVTDVSVFSINLVTALGLGLAIDYSLLMVSRFREELSAGHGVDAAVIRTVESAGRTVVFSAVTVAVALTALVVFPLYFLRSFAYAGVGVVLVAALAAVITLPALFMMLGHRVNAWRLPGMRRERGGESARWAAAARWILRRPGVVTGVVVTLLVLVSLPILGVQFGNPDARVLPADSPARTATEKAQHDFGFTGEALPVVITGSPQAAAAEGHIAAASRLEHVAQVVSAHGTWADGRRVGDTPQAGRYVADAGEWFEVVPSVQPMSPEAEELVRELRALDPSHEAVVGGSTAQLIDTKKAIFSVAPWAGLWIVLATMVLLFLMFGSVLVPLKAVALNALNLTAMLGAMVWIFQDGHLSGVLGFTPTGLTDVAMPLLMFAVAFGLSMDYEVFLLARIKEEYDRTGDNTTAIVAGIARTGRIVTAAALVLSITFFAFATSGVTFMKLFGLGLGLAILIDAFVVRATLVPALMKLAGKANWWAPAWARRLYERVGMDETAGPRPAERPTGEELVLPDGRGRS
ncbi:putative RND superfamily drug exporter [Mycobacterium tuberculosis]|nr:putative RND superfamily drug exporter [Mycobacterium tuberculosis]